MQTISGSGTCNFKNLILNNSNGLDITGGTINIEQIFDLQSGNVDATGSTVVLESNSENTAGQLNLGSSTYTGNLTVERYLSTSAQGYRMFGSPIQGTTLADWMDDGIIFSGFPGSNFPTFWGGVNSYTYDESLATNADKEAGWVSSDNITNQLVLQVAHSSILMLQHILYQSQDYPIKDLNPSQFKVEELLIKEAGI